ncbi:hypothetical protein TBK1r_42220 [Stieleria magnilauensis]|uniref:Uncharacterized protein n=1 Tax=Stieleria magnilauensis TaxID=2527963 RepID=A0ABX5XTA4_9BACT|nr:hypothetical protein TBK1r_42220 [Planctomycetes bacterium TBK1r]
MLNVRTPYRVRRDWKAAHLGIKPLALPGDFYVGTPSIHSVETFLVVPTQFKALIEIVFSRFIVASHEITYRWRKEMQASPDLRGSMKGTGFISLVFRKKSPKKPTRRSSWSLQKVERLIAITLHLQQRRSEARLNRLYQIQFQICPQSSVK